MLVKYNKRCLRCEKSKGIYYNKEGHRYIICEEENFMAPIAIS